jgi:hypothetical protein
VARIWTVRWFLCAAIVLWSVLAITRGWRPTSDSALYLMLARSLARGQGCTLFGVPDLSVPPGYPLFLAGLERAHLGSMFDLNIVMAAIGLAAVWAGYKLVAQIASQPVALSVACFVGLNAVWHAVSARQLSDMPFTLLVLTGLACLLHGLRRQTWTLEAGSLAIAASCGVRAIGVALVLGCLVGLLQSRHRPRARVLCNAALMLACVAGGTGLCFVRYRYSLHAAGTLLPPGYLPLIQSLVEQPAQIVRNLYNSGVLFSLFFTSQQMPAVLAHLLFACPIAIGLRKSIAGGDYLLPSAAAAYLCVVAAVMPTEARYLVPIAPLLAYYWLDGLSAILSHLAFRQLAPRAFSLAVLVLLAMNAIKGVDTLFKTQELIRTRTAELCAAAQLLHSQAGPGEQFVSSHRERELAYLSDVPLLQTERQAAFASMAPDDYLKFIFRQRVRFVVLATDEGQPSPDTDVFRRAVVDRAMFERLGEFGRFQVYRLRAPSTTSKAAAAN